MVFISPGEEIEHLVLRKFDEGNTVLNVNVVNVLGVFI